MLKHMPRNSSFCQRQTEGRPVPGLDHGPDGVIGLVDRQIVLLVLGGSLLLWQNMGSEGHRDSPRWVKIPFINHPAPLLEVISGKCISREHDPSSSASEVTKAGWEFQTQRKGSWEPSMCIGRDWSDKTWKAILVLNFEQHIHIEQFLATYSFLSVNKSITECFSQCGAWIHSPPWSDLSLAAQD